MKAGRMLTYAYNTHEDTHTHTDTTLPHNTFLPYFSWIQRAVSSTQGHVFHRAPSLICCRLVVLVANLTSVLKTRGAECISWLFSFYQTIITQSTLTCRPNEEDAFNSLVSDFLSVLKVIPTCSSTLAAFTNRGMNIYFMCLSWCHVIASTPFVLYDECVLFSASRGQMVCYYVVNDLGRRDKQFVSML